MGLALSHLNHVHIFLLHNNIGFDARFRAGKDTMSWQRGLTHLTSGHITKTKFSLSAAAVLVFYAVKNLLLQYFPTMQEARNGTS